MTRRLFHKRKPFPLWASLSLLAGGLGLGYLLLPEPAAPPQRADHAAAPAEPQRAPPALQPSPQPMGFGADLVDRPAAGRGIGAPVAEEAARPSAAVPSAPTGATEPAPATTRRAPSVPAEPPSVVAVTPAQPGGLTLPPPAGQPDRPIAADPGLLAPTDASRGGPDGGATPATVPKPVARQRPPAALAQRTQPRPEAQDLADAGTPATPPTAVAAGPSGAEPASPPLAPVPAATVDTAAVPAPAVERPRGARQARVQLTSAVRNREPVDQLDRVSGAQSVYGFSEIRGLAGRSVEHRWQHDGRVVSSMRLSIGGDRWRVQSRKPSTPDKGTWEFIVLDDEGNVLGRSTFVVE